METTIRNQLRRLHVVTFFLRHSPGFYGANAGLSSYSNCVEDMECWQKEHVERYKLRFIERDLKKFLFQRKLMLNNHLFPFCVLTGLHFIGRNFSVAMDEQVTAPIGFNITFPGLLSLAIGTVFRISYKTN
jgi:hypothetical protein